jgi:hypothetical protein
VGSDLLNSPLIAIEAKGLLIVGVRIAFPTIHFCGWVEITRVRKNGVATKPSRGIESGKTLLSLQRKCLGLRGAAATRDQHRRSKQERKANIVHPKSLPKFDAKKG